MLTGQPNHFYCIQHHWCYIETEHPKARYVVIEQCAHDDHVTQWHLSVVNIGFDSSLSDPTFVAMERKSLLIKGLGPSVTHPSIPS